MTDTDIALLLADAADGVEIGIAPTQAVIRGGRRRRARRWAVAAGAALALAGTTGAVALTGLPGGDGARVTPAVTRPPEHVSLTEPHRTQLASGVEDGKGWQVYVDVWDAPRNKAEAETQLTAMAGYRGEWPASVRTAADLVGKTTYFVQRSYQGDEAVAIENSLSKGSAQVSTDMDAGAIGLAPESKPLRLVIGRIAKSAEEVTCLWKDGTSTVLHRVAGQRANGDFKQGIRTVEGSQDRWFACLAPKGTAYQDARVTGLAP
ncbi:hypothetical protein ABZZ74_10935 [Streptomyces sp. NPDC006476]|uniref:hypothetical protein n=1 Tax=Streptomyces sp. NPDC006476 TaxID=3157175 RepID=UPI0033BEC88F